MAVTTAFRFEYRPATIRYGTGSVAHLAAELDAIGVDSALVVCGQTVGSTPAVLDPVKEGLGDRLAGVFAETTPQKRISTAIAAVGRMQELGAEALVGLGGGSSLDVANIAAAIDTKPGAPEEIGAEFEETGTLTVDEQEPPVVAVPTTLAGAELSQVAGVNADPETCPVDERVTGGVSHPALMPEAVVADPELFATTPQDVLTASAMNGFDKGVETLYTHNTTPVTDATATRGLQYLVDSLPELGERVDVEVVEPAVKGLLLVQYGISRPDQGTLSLIHAYGHGLTAFSDIQQGAAHAVIAPHALRYLFEQVDGRRELLAAALNAPDADDPAEAAVAAVQRVRDGLGLPARLRDTRGPDPDQFEVVAQAVKEDRFMPDAPAGLEPTVEELEAVLQAAY